MASGPHVGGFNLLGTLYLVLVVAAILVPMLMGRGRSPGDEDEGRGGGPGGGPPQPPPAPRGPSDGVPLEDAETSRVRLRDHGRLADRRPRPARRSTSHPPSTPRPRV
jgi:hypothetical protein